MEFGLDACSGINLSTPTLGPCCVDVKKFLRPIKSNALNEAFGSLALEHSLPPVRYNCIQRDEGKAVAHMAETAEPVQLDTQTTAAFKAYVDEAEAKMPPRLDPGEPFLWSDLIPERARQVRKGQIVAELWKGKAPLPVPHGLIHDWVGAVWVAGATVKDTVALVQDYDHHQQIYHPDVIDSKLLSRQDNDFKSILSAAQKEGHHRRARYLSRRAVLPGGSAAVVLPLL